VIALLDVNTLVALAWPNHSHHVAAHRWFGQWMSGWATCGLTETGFARVSSNRAAIAAAVRPVDAIVLLGRLREVPGHSFWIDNVEHVVGNELDATRVLGHQQVADAHLIALAIAHDGTVATFDRGLRSLVGKQHAGRVTLISV
jgi:toxin-antitoxin system PIN domain toxin